MSNRLHKSVFFTVGLMGLVLFASNSLRAQSSSSKKKAMTEATQPFAFMELFTSEGCSSCPSADENLERIAAQAKASGLNIYTLSYHVDYWDYLGWKDPYGSKEFSQRQRKYARQFESSRVYTPQMIVNGQAEFVGSNRKKSDRAVEIAMKQKPSAAVQLQAVFTDGKVKVNWRASGDRDGEMVVALVQNEGEQSVTRGENARRKLTHVNIVRDLQSVRQRKNSGQLEFDPPEGFTQNGFHVVGFLQNAQGISAASKSNIKSNSSIRNSSSRNGTSLHHVISARSLRTRTTQKPALVSVDRFLEMLNGEKRTFETNLEKVSASWNVSYVPMILEVGRFLPPTPRRQLFDVMEAKTGQKFGLDFDKWLQWNWSQTASPHPDYAKFQSKLYRKIDPRFAEYFTKTDNANIRLDEIRWGGVIRDGIPPLKNPDMLAANEADYLSDSDVVFGIELNGDARAYPKRILAWHEMFKDTIGDISVAGVY